MYISRTSFTFVYLNSRNHQQLAKVPMPSWNRSYSFLSFFTLTVLNSPFHMYVKCKRANKWQEEPKLKHSKAEMVHKMAWQRMWWNNWKTWDNEIISEHQGLFQLPIHRNDSIYFFPFQPDSIFTILSGEWKMERKYGAWLSNQFAIGQNKSLLVRKFKIPSELRYFHQFPCNCHAHRM